MNGLPYDTWRLEKLPIFIKLKALKEVDDRNQTAMIKPDGRSSEEDTWTHLDSLDAATTIRRWKRNDREIVAHDREIMETRGVSDLHQTTLNLSERGPRRGPWFRRLSSIGRWWVHRGTDGWCKTCGNPFKNRCISSFPLNFSLIREAIERNWSKILSSLWSPTFRLNCESIGAGLITNHYSISSNFPHEFRTSARKKSCKFASIRVNWSPILTKIELVVRFNRLSGDNLSFN